MAMRRIVCHDLFLSIAAILAALHLVSPAWAPAAFLRLTSAPCPLAYRRDPQAAKSRMRPVGELAARRDRIG